MSGLVLTMLRVTIALLGALITAGSMADLESWHYRKRKISAQAVVGLCLLLVGLLWY